jgi:hypothetical protein
LAFVTSRPARKQRQQNGRLTPVFRRQKSRKDEISATVEFDQPAHSISKRPFWAMVFKVRDKNDTEKRLKP